MRLIDADALIEELKDSIYKTGFGGDEFESGNQFGIEGAIERVKSAPTVHGDNPSPWIPVSERLPEEDQWVIAFSSPRGWNNYPIKVMQFKTCNGPKKFHDWGISSYEATHWMELPNPPTE